jgi:hypothetical protein
MVIKSVRFEIKVFVTPHEIGHTAFCAFTLFSPKWLDGSRNKYCVTTVEFRIHNAPH